MYLSSTYVEEFFIQSKISKNIYTAIEQEESDSEKEFDERVEKLNRTLRNECVGHWKYSQDDLLYVQEKVDEFVDYYHNKRPHLALNFSTPSQFMLQAHLTCNTTKICRKTSTGI